MCLGDKREADPLHLPENIKIVEKTSRSLLFHVLELSGYDLIKFYYVFVGV